MNKYIDIIKKQQELINLLLNCETSDTEKISPINNNISSEPVLHNCEYKENDFKTYLTEKGLSKNTISTYVTSVKLFFSNYDKMNAENLKKWEAELYKNNSPKTINLRIVGMTKYCKFIGFEDYVFKKPKVQKQTFCDTAINEKQYNQLIEWAKANSIQTYKIVRIIASTGVRVSELITLKTETLKKGYADITGKGNKTRRIYYPKNLIDDIAPLCDGEYLIMNKYGKQITTRGISQILVKAGELALIPKEVMHPHSFRHFFAKQFLKEKNDITLLGDLLGHSNISTTAIYTRMTSDEQQEALNNIVNW